MIDQKVPMTNGVGSSSVAASSQIAPLQHQMVAGTSTHHMQQQQPPAYPMSMQAVASTAAYTQQHPILPPNSDPNRFPTAATYPQQTPAGTYRVPTDCQYVTTSRPLPANYYQQQQMPVSQQQQQLMVRQQHYPYLIN